MDALPALLFRKFARFYLFEMERCSDTKKTGATFPGGYQGNQTLRRSQCICECLFEAQRGDSEEGIVPVHMPDTQPEDTVAAEHLGGVEEVSIAKRGDVIVGKSHEWDFPVVHQNLEMGVGDRKKLEPLGAAARFSVEALAHLGYGEGLESLARLDLGKIKAPGSGRRSGPQPDILRFIKMDILTMPGLPLHASYRIFPGQPSGEDGIGMFLTIIPKAIEKTDPQKTITSITRRQRGRLFNQAELIFLDLPSHLSVGLLPGLDLFLDRME